MHGLKRYSKTLFFTAGLLVAAIVAGCGGGDQGRGPILGLPAADLATLVVTPAVASVAVGATAQFVATATYADGATRDVSTLALWSAGGANAKVGAGNGLAAGLAVGSAAIGASFGGKSGGAVLTVTAAVITALSVAPHDPIIQAGSSRQLLVTALYSDGTTADVTATSAFVSALPAVVAVDRTGMAGGLAPGVSMVTVSNGGKSATTTVTVPVLTLSAIGVTPANQSVMVGAGQQFVATATYSDASTAIVTANVLWSSSDPAIGAVLPGGLASGLLAGNTTISASFGAVSGNAMLTVTAPVVVPPVPPVPPAALAVNLRSAASFAVLAGTSLTNNSGGTTLITGDVGAPSQTTAPTLAAGFTNYQSGAILAAAMADLTAAIADGNGRSCDVDFQSGIDLGGLVLSPGVYCYAGAISVTGTFTMNGPGVYIFRTASTLNTTANAIVALSGGATAAQVFWLPVGPTTLGANSVFKGTILGQSAAITMGDNASLLGGRVLTAAAATLRNNQISK